MDAGKRAPKKGFTMTKTFLALDCNYLCHRAYHAMNASGVDFDGMGATFGFLRDIAIFQEMFNTTNTVFCWDYGKGLREQHTPSYKASRRARHEALPEEEQEALSNFHIQVDALREEYLSEIGFSNIFYQEGYEADDMIASVCNSLPKECDIVMVSSDQDLYQLLSKRVVMFNPHKKKTFTDKWFFQTYGLAPPCWADVKALAGCATDDVAGVRGIGEITACKLLRGEMLGSESWKKFKAFDRKTNLRLVELPYEGTQTFVPKEDTVTQKKWNLLCYKLGLETIQRNAPSGTKKGFGL